MYRNKFRVKKNNSIKEMIDVLKSHPFITENELNKRAFGYDRNSTHLPNKKYADMLRRGLNKGTIQRIYCNVKDIRSKYFYYVPPYLQLLKHQTTGENLSSTNTFGFDISTTFDGLNPARIINTSVLSQDQQPIQQTALKDQIQKILNKTDKKETMKEETGASNYDGSFKISKKGNIQMELSTLFFTIYETVEVGPFKLKVHHQIFGYVTKSGGVDGDIDRCIDYTDIEYLGVPIDNKYKGQFSKLREFHKKEFDMDIDEMIDSCCLTDSQIKVMFKENCRQELEKMLKRVQ
jgi:hypothetical protein